MIIKTRKLPATNNDGERMRATMVGNGATLTIPFPYEAEDPGFTVAAMLARAYDVPTNELTRKGEHRWEW